MPCCDCLVNRQRDHRHSPVGSNPKHRSELPDGFGAGVPALVSLNVSDNVLEVLPASLGDLSQLSELAFANNAITSLDNLGGLANTIGAVLGANNRLTAIPQWATAAPMLQHLQRTRGFSWWEFGSPWVFFWGGGFV